MKVLWFTNTPSLAEEKEGKIIVAGGWIKSLEKAIGKYCPEIELGVVFHSKNNKEPFQIGKTTYYPIQLEKTGKIQKIISKNKVKDTSEEMLPKYMKAFEDFKPDLLHIHGTENDFGKMKEHVEVPVIFSLQGITTVYEHKYFSGITKETIGRQSRAIKKRYLHYFKEFGVKAKRESETLKDAQYIFGRTFWDRNLSRILAPKARYFHIDRVLRDGFYSQEWSKSSRKQFKLITTMKSSIYKGLETLIDAAILLKEAQVDFIWQIAGIPEDNPLTAILSGKLSQVKSNLVFLGQVQEEELVNRLLDSDAFVQTSHIENSPNGVAEALYLGLPVVASFVGGTGTYIDNYKDGLIIQDGDPWIMAGAIKELHDDPGLAADLGRNARIRAKDRHDPKTIANNVLNAYKNILEPCQD